MPYTIKIKFKDSGNKGIPVKNTEVQWELKNEDEPVSNAATSTDDQGWLVIPDVDKDVEILTLHFTVSGVAGKVINISSRAVEKTANVKITGAVIQPVLGEPEVLVQPPRVCPLVVNADRDWLCYESLFNRVRNRKSNKKFEMGLYIIERKDVCVWFRDNLDGKTVESLTSAFFPDYEPQDHLIFSNHIWNWKKLEEISEDLTPRGKRRLVASGKQYRVNLDSFVVLPYNYYDNKGDSRALGTKKINNFSHQLDTAHKWDFWKTASRSSVVRAKRIKDKGAAWITVTEPLGTEWNWDYSLGDDERTSGDYSDLDFLLKGDFDATGWKLRNIEHTADILDVSLKTGVMFVGSEKQSGTGKKDFLDENWIIACLRSDYVAAVNKEMEAKSVVIKDQKLVVLTELLSITEKTPRNVEVELEKVVAKKVVIEKTTAQVNDGIQVRDLSALDTAKIYLAPLNIPHVDIDLKEFKDEFACLGDEKWCEFWRKHWAISLGRAKALFLLRYGLQHINPNPQNYLIEFEMDGETVKPTERIIIRDLQDAAIHREVVWALYGFNMDLPLQGEGNRNILTNVFQPAIEYEFREIAGKSQETGTIDKTQNFGPSGTQFLWQRFSAFGSGNKPENVKAHKDAGRWQLFLTTMAKWGKSHNRSYVRCVEHQLGVNLTAIDWLSIPSPERYLAKNLAFVDIGKMCIDYKIVRPPGTGQNPPVISWITTGNFPGLLRKTAEISDKVILENWEELFGTEFPDEFKELGEKSCVILKGSNFVNPKIKFGELEIGKLMFTVNDKKNEKIYFIVDKDSDTLFSRKFINIEVTNNDQEGKPIGTALYTFEPSGETDMGWEESAAGKVHDYLKSKDGQRAVRQYKKRGWKPVEPSFCIKVLDAKRQPIEEFPLRLKRGGYETQWTDLTDGNGEIQIYDCSLNECQINFPEYDDVYVEVDRIRECKEMAFERRGKFVATVQVVEQ